MRAPDVTGDKVSATAVSRGPLVTASLRGTLGLFLLALALMLQPGDGRDGWVMAGDRLSSAARYTLALAYYTGADAGSGYGGGLDLRVGRVHLSKGRLAAAGEWLGRAMVRCDAAAKGSPISSPPLSLCRGEARLLLGEVNARTSDPRDAALFLAQALDDGAADAAYPLAMAMLRLGQDPAATDLLQAEAGRGNGQARVALALLTAPSNPEQAAALLAAAARGNGTAATSVAGRLLTEAAVWALADDPAYMALLVGRSALKADMPEVALSSFAAAARLSPGYAQAHAYQAFALYALGDDSESLDACAAALNLDPAEPQALQTLGLVLWRQGRLGEARDALELALAANPANAAILSDLGDVYAALHDYDQAASDLSAAVRLDPFSPVPLLRLARFHLESLLGVPLGLEAARAALRLAPESGEATDLVGWGLYLSGDWTAATETLRRATVLAPASAEAHYHLGMAEWRAGNAAAARQTLQRAADLDTVGTVEPRALAAMARLP